MRSPTTWAANLAEMAAGGTRSPKLVMADRDEDVSSAFLLIRARIKGIPRIDAEPNVETPPKAGRLREIPR